MKFKCNIRREVRWYLRSQWKLEPMRLARETEKTEDLVLRSMGTLRSECWCIKGRPRYEQSTSWNARRVHSCEPPAGGKEASHQWTKELLHAIRIGKVHSVGTQIVVLSWEIAHSKQDLQNLDFKPLCTQSCPKDVLMECYVLDTMHMLSNTSLIMTTFVHILRVTLSVC